MSGGGLRSFIESRGVFQATFRLHRPGSRRVPLALLVLTLAAGHSGPASADHSFEHAEDLGKVTDWPLAGREFVGEFEDVEGTDYEYLKFELEAAGSGAACDVMAAHLEGLDPSPTCLGGSFGGSNSLGDGAGKWQLFVAADQPIHIMSLLESATGHLTNLSAPTSRQVFSAPASPQTDNQ